MKTKKAKIIISVIVIITSLLTFGLLNAESELEEVNITWRETTYDINDTVVLNVSPYPTDAEISTLSISDNPIADMVYENGKATITFKSLGTSDIYFIANDTVTSNTTTITVIDEAAEEQKRLEEEARKAEEERLAAEQKAEEERLAAEQAAAEQAAQEQASIDQTPQPEVQQPQEEMVWIPASGKRYHSNSSCSGMDSPTQVTISEAQALGFTPCGRCY